VGCQQGGEKKIKEVGGGVERRGKREGMMVGRRSRLGGNSKKVASRWQDAGSGEKG